MAKAKRRRRRTLRLDDVVAVPDGWRGGTRLGRVVGHYQSHYRGELLPGSCWTDWVIYFTETDHAEKWPRHSIHWIASAARDDFEVVK